MTSRKPPGVSFESWVESQIRSAEERGAFRDLPGAGRPLRGLDRQQSSYEWALEWARRENVDPLGMLPPGLALRREKQDLPAVLARMSSEEAVRARLEDFNARVEAYWRAPADGPQVPIGQVDVDEVVARWRAERTTPPPVTPAPAAAVRRRWWHRRRRAAQ